MNNLSPRVLLLGGTGFVGRHVCEKLTRIGCRMTVITRRASQAAAIQSMPKVRVHGAARCSDQSDCHLAWL